MVDRPTIDVKPDEDQITALNLQLKREGNAGFWGFAKSYIDSMQSSSDTAANSITKKFVQRLASNLQTQQPQAKG